MQETGQIPDCSFYLPVSTCRDSTVTCPIFLRSDVSHQNSEIGQHSLSKDGDFVRSKNFGGSRKKCKKVWKRGKGGWLIRGHSGPTPVARGGCGAPPLAARLYWQVVNRSLLRLLGTNITIYNSLAVNYKVGKPWAGYQGKTWAGYAERKLIRQRTR